MIAVDSIVEGNDEINGTSGNYVCLSIYVVGRTCCDLYDYD